MPNKEADCFGSALLTTWRLFNSVPSLRWIGYIQSLVGEPNPYALNRGHDQHPSLGTKYWRGQEKGGAPRLAS